MRSLTLPAALVGLLGAATVAGQSASPFLMARCEADAAPAAFGSINLPKPVLANGLPLPAGTYQVQITTERPAPAPGQSPTSECWVEFLQADAVCGREVASVVAAADLAAVAKGPAPGPGTARVDLLKEGEYVRVWINREGAHYILNLPVAR